MRMPNGFGSVHKLSGKRRKPWRVRKTTGWIYVDKETGEEVDVTPDTDMATVKVKQLYATIGYYATQKEAIQALADYNADPYDLRADTITFAEVFERWFAEHSQKVSQSNINGIKASYKICDSIKDLRIAELKLNHLQQVVNESGKNTPTLKKLKVMLGLMFEYAVRHEIVEPAKRDMISYIDINFAGNPNALDRKPFSKKQIDTLWKNKDNVYVQIVLMLIYTGVRIGEFLDLKKEDVHLEERWFFVREAKTSAGIREVPIAEKIVPFFEYWLSTGCEYLVCTPDDQHFLYRNYYDSYWEPILEQLNMSSHRPHDTRHTCISLLTSAGVDERIIKKIVGHKGQGITEQVYTHVDLPDKLTAINKI